MSIFKECDVRGVYGSELTDSHAYAIGRAVATRFAGKSLLVSGDVRVSTPVLKLRLIEGLLDSGADVLDIGINPTPVAYFAKTYLQKDVLVQVTASHNPREYNGFKIYPLIDDLEYLVTANEFMQGEGKLSTGSVTELYIQSTLKNFVPHPMKVVVDGGNGCVCQWMPRMFGQLGVEVVPLFCEVDGSFPNRSPNPAVYANLSAVCAKVRETGADFGCAFDGDGDRVVFIDEKGNAVTSEQSLSLFIKHLCKQGDSVVYDLKSSSVVKRTCEQLGVKPVMERSGHAFIKKTFLSLGSTLAGEISGHFFFQELGYDDGLYGALCMYDLLSKSDKTLSELVQEVGNTNITPDIRLFVPYEERDALMEQVLTYAKNFDYTTLDGVRLELNGGWALIRKSVTEQGVTLRVEGEDTETIVQMLRSNIPLLKKYYEVK